MEGSLENQAAAEKGQIPPLMSSSGQQKAEEGGALVLLRQARIDLNVSYKKKESVFQGGLCLLSVQSEIILLI